MECLNIINWRECETESPVTIETFIEANKTILAHLANENEHSGTIYGADLLEYAKNKLYVDLSTAEGAIQYNTEIVRPKFTPSWVSANSKGGVQIFNLSRSPLTKIHITRIEYYPRFVGAFNITIDDGIAPVIIPATATTANAVNYIDVTYSTSALSVKIYCVDFFFGLLSNVDSSCSTCGGGGKVPISMSGIAQDLTSSTILTGFYPITHLACDNEGAICTTLLVPAIKMRVQEAISYAVGVRLYERFLMSSRLNDTTVNIDKKAVEEYKDTLQGKYVELVNGSKNITGLVKLVELQLKKGDYCIICRPKYGYAFASV